MSSEQFFYLVAILAFLSGASAILKVRTMQNTIDRQGELLAVQDRQLASSDRETQINKSQNIELRRTVEQQQQQITVLTNTVNSSDLIKALDEHLAAHHREAMEKLDRQHRDFVSLKSMIQQALKL